MRFPAGVRTITWSTAIRFIGWGLVEALLPIFIQSFTGNYLETALISGAFYACFLLTIPFAGVLADRISARGMLLTSMALYLFIGVSYYLAGHSGLILGIILARALNGVAFSLDVVARYTYFRRHVDKKYIGRAFGHLTAVANFWWLAALVASLAVVDRVATHYLFLAITITAIGSLLLIYRKLPRDREHQSIRHTHVFAAYKDMYKRMRARNVGIFTLGFLAYAIGLLGAIITFFIPLYVHEHFVALQFAQADTYRIVVFTTGVLALPLVFAKYFGSFVDKLQHRAVFYGLGAMIVLLSAFPFIPFYAQLAVAFGIAAALEVLVLALATIVTHRVKPVRYGRAESVMQVAGNVGTISGAVVLGIFNQWFGGENAFILLAIMAGITLAVMVWRRKYLLPVIVKH